jgi:hypothetical protein
MTVYRVTSGKDSGFAVEVTHVSGWVQTIDEFATREEAIAWVKDRLAAAASGRYLLTKLVAFLAAGGL